MLTAHPFLIYFNITFRPGHTSPSCKQPPSISRFNCSAIFPSFSSQAKTPLTIKPFRADLSIAHKQICKANPAICTCRPKAQKQLSFPAPLGKVKYGFRYTGIYFHIRPQGNQNSGYHTQFMGNNCNFAPENKNK